MCSTDELGPAGRRLVAALLALGCCGCAISLDGRALPPGSDASRLVIVPLTGLP